MCDPTELQKLSEADLIEMNLALGVQQDEIREKRVSINTELRARATRLADARAEVARLESRDAVVEGQTLDVTAGV